MRCVFAIITASCVLSAQAVAADHHASKAEILASTKKLSAKDCRAHPIGYGSHIAGCTYSQPFFLNGQWNVFVRYRMTDENGRPEYPQGAESIYVFDGFGKFVKTLAGM